MIEIRKDALARHRADAGLTTNTALAAAMDMSPSAVGRTLAGKRARPVSAEFITGLLRAFPHLEFTDLFTRTDDRIPA